MLKSLLKKLTLRLVDLDVSMRERESEFFKKIKYIIIKKIISLILVVFDDTCMLMGVLNS